jgi:SAM-dependent methyltransferase
MDNGWDASAAAWIADMANDGDFGRRHVLDAPMLARIASGNFTSALDIGCGEGRFCRKLAALGIPATGIDPTAELIAEARCRDTEGDYRIAAAEALPLGDAAFELVICYLSLIDIDDLRTAIAEITRVLAPGGTLLIANLTSFNTARSGTAEQTYLDEFAAWEEWRGIRVRNWHRPLSRYMTLLLDAGLTLRHFDEPAPTGGEPAKAKRYRKWPNFLIMEWQKPKMP